MSTKIGEYRDRTGRYEIQRTDEGAWRCTRLGFTHGQTGEGVPHEPCKHLLDLFAHAKAGVAEAPKDFACSLEEAERIGRVARGEAREALEAGDLDKARDDMRIAAAADLAVARFKARSGR